MQKLRNQGPDSSTIAPDFCAVRSWAGTEIHPIHTAKRSIMSSGSWNCQKGGTADMRCQHDSPPLLMGPVSAPVSVGLQRPSSEQAAAEENAIPRGGLPQMGQTVYGVVESWNGASFVVTVQAEGCLLRGLMHPEESTLKRPFPRRPTLRCQSADHDPAQSGPWTCNHHLLDPITGQSSSSLQSSKFTHQPTNPKQNLTAGGLIGIGDEPGRHVNYCQAPQDFVDATAAVNAAQMMAAVAPEGELSTVVAQEAEHSPQKLLRHAVRQLLYPEVPGLSSLHSEQSPCFGGLSSNFSPLIPSAETACSNQHQVHIMLLADLNKVVRSTSRLETRC